MGRNKRFRSLMIRNTILTMMLNLALLPLLVSSSPSLASASSIVTAVWPPEASLRCQQNAIELLHDGSPVSLDCRELTHAQQQQLALELTKCHLAEVGQPTFTSEEQSLHHMTSHGVHTYTIFKTHLQRHCLELKQELYLQQHASLLAHIEQRSTMITQRETMLEQSRLEMEQQRLKLNGLYQDWILEALKKQNDLDQQHHNLLELQHQWQQNQTIHREWYEKQVQKLVETIPMNRLLAVYDNARDAAGRLGRFGIRLLILWLVTPKCKSRRHLIFLLGLESSTRMMLPKEHESIVSLLIQTLGLVLYLWAVIQSFCRSPELPPPLPQPSLQPDLIRTLHSLQDSVHRLETIHRDSRAMVQEQLKAQQYSFPPTFPSNPQFATQYMEETPYGSVVAPEPKDPMFFPLSDHLVPLIEHPEQAITHGNHIMLQQEQSLLPPCYATNHEQRAAAMENPFEKYTNTVGAQSSAVPDATETVQASSAPATVPPVAVLSHGERFFDQDKKRPRVDYVHELWDDDELLEDDEPPHKKVCFKP